jgi:hypothetical protein
MEGNMKKTVILLTTAIIALAFTVLPVLALDPPKVNLERVEVATIQPFFVKPRIGYKSEKEPGKVGKYGYSSTLNVAYILKIENPNKEPVMLDEIQFTTEFDGFEVNTLLAYEDSWIPGGKANEVKVIATNEAFPTIISLMVGAQNVEKIKEMKTSAGKLVGKWWNSIADFSFPIEIKNGTALFQGEDGKEMRVSFTGKWGGEKK